MGFPYTLIKKECPEAYDLGKGFWDKVFDREYGHFNFFKMPDRHPTHEGSNFEETFRIDMIQNLEDKIKKYLPRWADNPDLSQKISDDIKAWAGSSEIFLINYWEEVEYYQERKWRKKCAEEFTDLRDHLANPLYEYKIVKSIYDD